MSRYASSRTQGTQPDQYASREATAAPVRGAWRLDRLTGATMTELRAANELDKLILKDPPKDDTLKVVCYLYSQLPDFDREVISSIVFNVASGFNKIGPLSVLELVWNTALFVAAKEQRVYQNNVQWKREKKQMVESYAERKELWSTK